MKTLFYNSAHIIKLIPLELLIKLTGQNIIFPFYHTISDEELVHIKHLYPVRTTKQFEKDLDFLLKKYKPIGYTDLADSLKKGEKVKENCFLLTFDDGLREFHDIVAPILFRKGIQAICFLNSAFIDNKDLFFRYKASILIEKLRTREFSPAMNKKIENWFFTNQLSTNLKYQSLTSIKYQKKYLLDELSKLLEVEFIDYLKSKKPYLEGSQIKSLIGQGFDFGGHSIDHPQYSDLDIEEQIKQTKESTDTVAHNYGLDYRIFSFPFTDYGVGKSFFERVLNAEPPIADLTFGCAGLKKDEFRQHIQRIPIESANNSAEKIIYGEYFYYLLKGLISKNTIKRY